MSDKTIEFKMGSWLENAGIVGLTRVLDKDDYIVKNKSLLVKVDALDSFSDKYFKYFINQYGKYTKYNKIIEYKKDIAYWLHDISTFTKDDIEKVNDFYKEKLKYSVTSASYKKVYPLIESDFDPLTEIKVLADKMKDFVKLKKVLEFSEEQITIIKNVLRKIAEFIEYFDQKDSHKYFPAKTLCYTVINSTYNGISFLNPQTKILNFYDDYQEYFVSPILQYLEEDHEKDMYICSCCQRPMKRQDYAFSFLTGMGYDVNRKTSNGWNHIADLYMCPSCQLMYSCTNAGFNYDNTGRGTFVNYNHTLDSLIRANQRILAAMNIASENSQAITSYQAFIRSFEKETINNAKYELANIQLINYNDGKYVYIIIPRLATNIIRTANTIEYGKTRLLSYLLNAGIRDFNGERYYRIYDAVIDHLFNAQNLFGLVHTMESLYLSGNSSTRFNGSHIYAVLKINDLYLKELGIMEARYYSLRNAKDFGEALKKGYQNENKAISLAYRLLTALKARNTLQFMDILLNACLYQETKIIPEFINNQNKEEVFLQYGYALVAGLIGVKEYEKKVGNDNE